MSGFRSGLSTSGGGGSLPDPVTIAHGGTGQTTANAGFAALAALVLGQTSTIALSDNLTNTAPIARVLSHASSGTAAASFGVGDAVDLQNGSGTLKRVMTDVTTLTTATAGSEAASRKVQVMKAGALQDVLTLAPDAVTVSTSLTGIQKVLKLASPASGDPAISWLVNGAEVAYLRALATDQRFAFNGNFVWGDLTETFTYLKIIAGGGLGSTGVQFFRRLRTQREANLASATTLTLGVSGNLFPITGTTTVNGIVTTDWDPGSRITLELPSGITITHNSGAPGTNAVAIQLRAGANLTTSGVYMLDLIYNGTFWYQPG